MTIKVGDRVVYRPGRRARSVYRVTIIRKAYDGSYITMQSVRSGRLTHKWSQHLISDGWRVEPIARSLLLPKGA